jgi:hypothetical protein
LKILPVCPPQRQKRPQSGDIDIENAYRKPPVTREFQRIFPAVNETSTMENIDKSQRRDSEESCSKHFQN